MGETILDQLSRDGRGCKVTAGSSYKQLPHMAFSQPSGQFDKIIYIYGVHSLIFLLLSGGKINSSRANQYPILFIKPFNWGRAGRGGESFIRGI